MSKSLKHHLVEISNNWWDWSEAQSVLSHHYLHLNPREIEIKSDSFKTYLDVGISLLFHISNYCSFYYINTQNKEKDNFPAYEQETWCISNNVKTPLLDNFHSYLQRDGQGIKTEFLITQNKATASWRHTHFQSFHW